MKKLEDIILDLKVELEFLGEKYSGIPLQPLYESVESLQQLLRNEITTPFSDDLGTEDNYCYPRELGEIHDTFNVVIQGSGNAITLTRQVITSLNAQSERSSQDDDSYLQSMVDVLSKLRSDK